MEQNGASASTQQQQDILAAQMRQQQEYAQQCQYMYTKQCTVQQIASGIQQIDPFEVIRTISQYYGICTLQLEQQEAMYLNGIIGRILLNDPNATFSVENWKDLLNILNNAISITFNIQTSQMGRGYGYGGMNGMMGGYNPQMGMMGGMGGFNPQMNMGMGMGMPGPQMGGMMGGYNPQMGMMGGMGNPYSGMNYGYGPNNSFMFNQNQAPKQEGDGSEEDERKIIDNCRQIFANRLFQTDPIIFLNCLLQGNFELKTDSNNEELPMALRRSICNALWRAQDNILQMIFQVVSSLYNSEYQKRINNGNNKQNQGQQQFTPGYQQPFMGAPQMNMGMGGFNYQGGPQMGGMGMMGGMPGFNPQMNMGMGMGMPGPQMGGMMGGFNPQMNMGMGMMPPMNGMGMNYGQFQMGGMGGFNPGAMGQGGQTQFSSSTGSSVW
jgi:hypothetical protein